jgi:hypothetical protein
MTLLSRLAPALLLIAFPASAAAADPSPEKTAILEWFKLHDVNWKADAAGDIAEVQFGCTSILRDKDLALLKAFPKLQTVHLLGDNDVSDAGLAHLRGMKVKKLTVVSENVTAKGLEHIATMPDLEDVKLTAMTMTPDGLAELKKLKHLKSLELRRTELTDAAIPTFDGFAKLEKLRINNNKLTDAGMEKVKALLPGAKVTR